MNNQNLSILIGTGDLKTEAQLGQFLQFVGQSGVWARTVEELENWLGLEPFDLVILDPTLPGISGVPPGLAKARALGARALWVALGAQPEGTAWFKRLALPLEIEPFQDCLRAACLERQTHSEPPNSSFSSGGSHLDWNLINKRRAIDPELVIALIHIFETDAPLMLVQIESFSMRSDWPELISICHKFKGMTANVGAASLTQLTEQIDRLAKKKAAAQLELWIDRLWTAYRLTLLEFETLLSELQR